MLSDADAGSWKVLDRELRQRAQGVGQRPARLFAVACCRRLEPLKLPAPILALLSVAERLAEGEGSDSLLTPLRQRISRLSGELFQRGTPRHPSPLQLAQQAALLLCSSHLNVATLSGILARAWQADLLASAGEDDSLPPRGRRARRRARHDRWLALVCDLFPGKDLTPLNPAWRTPLVQSMAQTMDRGRDFADLPILADALEEAGCTDQGLLEHLRWQRHTRGCWAMDVILGKSR